MAQLHNFINIISGFLWGNVIIVLLLAMGFFIIFVSRFFQLRMLKTAFKAVIAKKTNQENNKHITGTQALATSLASLIGVGSLAGMSVAIKTGGPGAIFWVWVITILGMGINLFEHVLGQVYKTKTADGSFIGGPSHYIRRGLGESYKYIAVLISVTIIIAYGFAFNSVQANTIGASLENTFNINKMYTALFLVGVTTLVMAGGIKRIAKTSEFLVPIMGIIYLLVAAVVIIINITEVPSIIWLIIKSAFGMNEAISGSLIGAVQVAMIIGIKRALFSTEAGLGSTPNISASASSDHPVEQGLLGMVGVFIVGIIICTSTAIVVLSSNAYLTTDASGIALLQNSLRDSVGYFAGFLVTLCVFIFAFTSIIGNYSYAENNIKYFSQSNMIKIILRVAVIAIVGVGTVASLNAVWDFADFLTAILALINVFALFMLRKVALAVIKDYERQLKEGKKPVFKKETVAELAGDSKNVW